MNKDCTTIQQNLSVHLDGELTGDPLRDLQGHLASCQSCRMIVKDYYEIGQILREEVALEMEPIDHRMMREKVRASIAPPARIRSWPGSGGHLVKVASQYVWQAALVLGVAMVIIVAWVTLRLPATPAHFGPGIIQEQLGQAIRDTARVRYSALQVSDRQQEELGRLIRDHSHVRWTQSAAAGLAIGRIQEQMGLLIRDHARSQWTMNRQSGQLQERIGKLIQDQARQKPK